VLGWLETRGEKRLYMVIVFHNVSKLVYNLILSPGHSICLTSKLTRIVDAGVQVVLVLCGVVYWGM
jgi:hypothetical protein